MVNSILRKLKKFYLKNLAKERRLDRAISRNPFWVKNEKVMRKYFAAQKELIGLIKKEKKEEKQISFLKIGVFE